MTVNTEAIEGAARYEARCAVDGTTVAWFDAVDVVEGMAVCYTCESELTGVYVVAIDADENEIETSEVYYF